MDCEKLESVLMDELYGELDEITSAAVKRHVAGCARCAALLGGLRATRRVAELPMVEVPVGLEERILAAAAADAPRGSSLKWGFARVLSLAGTWAMRPQTAMAAVSLVMIGTSVLLLRGRSSRAPASAEMIVTEEGTPAPVASASAVESTGASPPPATAAAAPAVVAAAPTPEPAADLRLKAAKAAPRADDEIAAAPMPMAVAARAPSGAAGVGAGAGGISAFSGAPVPAHARFAEAPAAAPGPSPFDANGELAEARSARDDAARRGLPCPSVARFDDVVNRAGGTAAGWDAVYEGALCYESNGDFASARNRLNVLLRVDPYKDRARAQLDQLSRRQQPAPAAAAPAAKPAAPMTSDEPASGAP
jgi:hypothetical protein